MTENPYTYENYQRLLRALERAKPEDKPDINELISGFITAGGQTFPDVPPYKTS